MIEYKVNFTYFFLSMAISTIAYFSNASYRDVLLEGYGVTYTSFAIAGAIATSLANFEIPYITRFELLNFGLWNVVLSTLLFSLLIGGFRALIIALFTMSYLKPSPNLLISFPFFVLLGFSVLLLLTVSDSLLKGENVLAWGYFGLWNLFSGVWFPVDALPFGLAELAVLLPQYHLINLVRDPLIGRLNPISLLYAVVTAPLMVALSVLIERECLRRGCFSVRA
ncbi:MAG: hypothetical protein QXR62_05055 [Candidatus Bathyarchaeia archaeon]